MFIIPKICLICFCLCVVKILYNITVVKLDDIFDYITQSKFAAANSSSKMWWVSVCLLAAECCSAQLGSRAAAFFLFWFRPCICIAATAVEYSVSLAAVRLALGKYLSLILQFSLEFPVSTARLRNVENLISSGGWNIQIFVKQSVRNYIEIYIWEILI